ncbi:MAG TPA: glutamate synthase-related protein [Thermoguttaceae bacterium]|nr:glutamate synthase-related protein [Thermoguttaceae bacterium]
MPAKYHIHTEPAPPRVRPVGKLGIVDWREDCSSCHNCVKRDCVYGFYRDEADTLRDETGYLDYIYQCKGCLNCVQDCTKGILTRVVNPEYQRLGDAHYTPDIILSTWFQAESGRIPVSGAGYGGPFSGAGFDGMWTDMSEIVRPTRDGIHGREYISTSVDVGRKLAHLRFHDGELGVLPPPLIQSPLPVMFEAIPRHWQRGKVVTSICRAAAEIGLFSIVRSQDVPVELSVEQENIIPWLETAGAANNGALSAAMVMVGDGENVMAVQAALKDENADRIVGIRVPAGPEVKDRVLELTRQDAEVIHLVFGRNGRELGAARPRHMRQVLREVHTALVEDGTRDLVTLSASGGIALAEHMAKAVVCGADLVAIDVPLVLALECRLCGECQRDGVCPIALEEIEPRYATRRVINLLGAWHQQLVELLGAMGIREVRRLRGETGRCMFFEDLERETFGRLFGKRKEPDQAACGFATKP